MSIGYYTGQDDFTKRRRRSTRYGVEGWCDSLSTPSYTGGYAQASPPDLGVQYPIFTKNKNR
jgi:hypothetical protein